MPSLDIAVPRVLSDATQVVSNPAAYANRPHLVHLARLTLMSAVGQTPAQRHRDAGAADRQASR